MKMPMAASSMRAPAVDVAELAVERRHRGGGEQVGGDDPGQVLDVAELAADGRQRGRDDGLVERRQEHRQHQAEDDRADRCGVDGRCSEAAEDVAFSLVTIRRAPEARWMKARKSRTGRGDQRFYVAVIAVEIKTPDRMAGSERDRDHAKHRGETDTYSKVPTPF